MLTKNELQELLNDRASICWKFFQSLYSELDTVQCPIVKLNNRLSVTAGLAYGDTHHVEIATRFYLTGDPDIFNYALKVVLPHEIIHIVDCSLHGVDTVQARGWHSAYWRRLMVQYGLAPDRCHSMPALKHIKPSDYGY